MNAAPPANKRKGLRALGIIALALFAVVLFAFPGFVRAWKDLDFHNPVFVKKSEEIFGREKVIVAWELLRTRAEIPGKSKFHPVCNIVMVKGLLINPGTTKITVQRIECVGKYKGFTMFSIPVFEQSSSPHRGPLVIEPKGFVKVSATEGVPVEFIRNPNLIDSLTSAFFFTAAPEPVTDYHKKLTSGFEQK